MAIGDVMASIGKGFGAGLAGTAVMTLIQRLEMEVSGRKGSTVPADAVEKVLELEPKHDRARERLAQLTHWGYGADWGAARGLLARSGLSWPAATAAHLGLVWGTSLLMLPALGLAPPPNKRNKEELAKDLAFHAVYALGAGLAYHLLDGRKKKR